MSHVGYARVSSVGQSLDVQLEKIKHCDKIFQEKKSGASDKHSWLKVCLEYVREGDTFVVTRLDRLARSTLHLCQIAAELERKDGWDPESQRAGRALRPEEELDPTSDG